MMMLMTSHAWGMKCKDYDNVAKYLDSKQFVRASRDRMDLIELARHERERARKKGIAVDPKYRDIDINKKELDLAVGDVNQAKVLAYRFPAFEDLGFGKPGNAGWTRIEGKLERSGLHGKKVGWRIENEKGIAEVRIDWDPKIGAHYNLEMSEGKTRHKLAIAFECGGKPCTEAQVIKMAERME
jgi:hypothetical protein